MGTQDRTWSIDLLRIIAMMMVLVLHINLFGGFLSISDHSMYHFCVILYEHLAIIAVNVFVIISAWFLSKGNPRFGKIIQLLIPSVFWSIVMTISAKLLGVQVSYKDILMQIPLIGKNYDFISGYITMYLLAPYVNKGLSNLSQRDHLALSIIVFSLFSALSVFNRCQYININMGYHFSWFVILYIITSYVRKYEAWKAFPKYFYLVIYLALSFIGTICEFYNIPYISGRPYNNPVVAISSFSLFFLFADSTVKGKYSVFLISKFAPLAFSVYLIHAHSLIEEWYVTLNVRDFINSCAAYLLIIPLLAFVIYIICCLLELCRLKIFSLLHIDNLIIHMVNKLNF